MKRFREGSVMSDEYREIVWDAILNQQGFLRATFSGQQRGEPLDWEKVTLRPVEIKGRKHIQFAYYDAKKCITKNYLDADLLIHLNDLLALPFKNIQVSTATGDIQIHVDKSGSPLIHRTRASRSVENSALTHDRQKDLLLPEGKPDPYLQAIGFMTGDGRIKADKHNKFRQINEFLKLLKQTGELEKFDKPVIEIVDYGCGNAYLTFATYHYLHNMLDRPVRMVGVDLRGELLTKHREIVRSLGWGGLTFE